MSSFQNIIFISRNSTNLPCFWRPSWILVAILNCPRMPDWHQSDFKSELPYLSEYTKTFSIDGIAHFFRNIEFLCRTITNWPKMSKTTCSLTSYFFFHLNTYVSDIQKYLAQKLRRGSFWHPIYGYLTQKWPKLTFFCLF